MRVTAPRPFPGTPEEAEKNFRTHQFSYDEDGDSRCMNCDCRPWGVWSNWPCNIDPEEVGYVTYGD